MHTTTITTSVRRRCAGILLATALTATAFSVSGLTGAAPAQAASTTAHEAARHAQEKIGFPYEYGGSGPDSFDCSGLIQWSYRQAGVDLPRTTYDQHEAGTPVDRDDLRYGDLLFFYEGPGHAGIYIGDGRMVHAPGSGDEVETVSLSGHFEANLTGAVRVA
ncbi:Cell wall-associated hydrolase, NlpC family [Marinactinospora thermotolerans DSM 45154]|uniref:Cell wall-associated hydrolase, NlpC family n=1 Tax=Marinactinospora thermotolerans DSM 45154 TaxID=1122192 RepID=A0A1T4RRU4_9ACTN|nr:C40 family peptidase [Marinactinospora thermotolerans]SKA18735.1 Cell wall-associated hydrolase, NlpC family [Marinactinospora thermotolerans DSM 45154]